MKHKAFKRKIHPVRRIKHRVKRRGSLTLHRVMFGFKPVGRLVTFVRNEKGQEYEHTWRHLKDPSDSLKFNFVPLVLASSW